MGRSTGETVRLVRSLAESPTEAPWLGFKVGNEKPETIGRLTSAIANSARLAQREAGYVVWGVRDGDHAIVGTGFRPQTAKIGNQGLINWLTTQVSPPTHLAFEEARIDDRHVVLLEVPAASGYPTEFSGTAYLRLGEHIKPLREHPRHARDLWDALVRAPFESDIASESLPGQQVLQLLDYEGYFGLLGLPARREPGQILEALAADGLVRGGVEGGNWAVTNLGAVLFARRLSDFPRLQRKAPRLIKYAGDSRVDQAREVHIRGGYAVSFEPLIAAVGDLLPVSEVLGAALRRDVPVLPLLAIRELVANALIHQDLHVSGSGPMIELFDDRLEVANPGIPLVDTWRFLDSPPRSRNEGLAALMRRIGACEERGTGWDKIATQVEIHQLRAPKVEVVEDSTRITLYTPKQLTSMDPGDRVRAVYLHACLRHVISKRTTNASVRERFGIAPENAAQASRLLREAMDAGRIRLRDPDASKRQTPYVPFWA